MLVNVYRKGDTKEGRNYICCLISAATLSIVVLNVSVGLLSAIAFVVETLGGTALTAQKPWLFMVLASILVVLGNVPKLFAMTYTIAMEKDWFVVLADNDNARLASKELRLAWTEIYIRCLFAR